MNKIQMITLLVTLFVVMPLFLVMMATVDLLIFRRTEYEFETLDGEILKGTSCGRRGRSESGALVCYADGTAYLVKKYRAIDE